MIETSNTPDFRPALADYEATVKALAPLTKRQQFVLWMRFREGKTLEDCGKILGLTRDGVRRIQREALEKRRIERGALDKLRIECGPLLDKLRRPNRRRILLGN